MKNLSFKKLIAIAMVSFSVLGLQTATYASNSYEQYAVTCLSHYNDQYGQPCTQPVISVPKGTSFEDVVALLPPSIQVVYTYGYDPAFATAEINWLKGDYSSSRVGACNIEGTLALNGLSNPNNFKAAATIKVLAPVDGFGMYTINGQGTYSKSATIARNTDLNTVLPDKVIVYTGRGYDAYRPQVNVTWDTSSIDVTKPGTYVLTGDFEMPEFSYNRDNIYPTFTITVQ